MPRTRDDVRAAGAFQGRECRENGSPLYAAIVDAVVAGPDSTAVRLLLDEPRDLLTSAAFLRLLGAVHRLVLREGAGNPLARYYPSVGGVPDLEAAPAAFLAFVDHRVDDVRTGLRADVQTNEVGRSAPLSAGLNALAGGTDADVVLLELGASAGLNLWPDRYRVGVDASCAWGPPDSPVRLEGCFVGRRPPSTAPRIVERRGCDLAPVDAGTEAGRLLLRSFVWPEDTARRARLDAALSVAGTVRVDTADLVDWAGAQLGERRPGLTVLFHSVVLPYVAPERREALTRVVEEAGAAADAGHRLAWLALEPGPDRTLSLTARRWPEATTTELATCAAHGGSICWLA